MNIEHIKDDLWILVALGSAAFYFMRSTQNEVLVGILIMTLWAWIALGYLDGKSDEIEASASSTLGFLKDAEKRKASGAVEIVSDVYDVSRIPHQGLKYVAGNKDFVAIINDLNFVKIFDKSRYLDLVVHMDKLQKNYVFTLSKRARSRDNVPIFVDLRDAVLEILYSLYLIVPPKLRHTYGIHPYNVIRENIRRFHAHTDRMLQVLHNFNKGAPYFTHSIPGGYENGKEHVLP